MNKSLFITYHYPPSGEVATLRVQALCRCLSDAGFPPEVITATEDSYELTSPGQMSKTETTSLHRLSVPTHPVLWVFNSFKKLFHPTKRDRADCATSPSEASRAPRPGGLLYRLARVLLELPDDKVLWGVKSLYHAWSLSRNQSYSFIISTAPPPTVTFVAYAVSKLTKTPLVLDYRDPWTITPTPHSGEYWPGWLRKLFTKVETAVLSHANLIIVNTIRHAEYLSERVTLGTGNIITVYNGHDTPPVPAKQSSDRADDHRITIAHFGSLYIKRNPIPFFEAVERLLKDNPQLKERLRITFYGRVFHDLSQLDSLPDCAQITELHSHIPHNDALQKMRDSDILLAFAEDQPLQIPAKLFEYIGLKKPVLLLGSAGAASDMIEEVGCGRTVPINDVQGITHALYELIVAEAHKEYLTYDSQALSRDRQMELLQARLAQQFK